jgi:hypothetical protein
MELKRDKGCGDILNDIWSMLSELRLGNRERTAKVPWSFVLA